MKNRSYKLKFLGFLAFFSFILVFAWEMFMSDQRTKEKNLDICLYYKKTDFNGEVMHTYKSKNRGTFTFILRNDEGEKELFNYCLVYPEAYIKKGDSICKIPNSFEYYIYKGGDLSQKVVVRCDDNYCDKWR